MQRISDYQKAEHQKILKRLHNKRYYEKKKGQKLTPLPKEGDGFINSHCGGQECKIEILNMTFSSYVDFINERYYKLERKYNKHKGDLEEARTCRMWADEENDKLKDENDKLKDEIKELKKASLFE